MQTMGSVGEALRHLSQGLPVICGERMDMQMLVSLGFCEACKVLAILFQEIATDMTWASSYSSTLEILTGIQGMLLEYQLEKTCQAVGSAHKEYRFVEA